MTLIERWFLYAAVIGAIILAERRLINHAIDRAERLYWERR